MKVHADTDEAARKIRALRSEVQAPPIEVLLVSEKVGFWRALITGTALLWLTALGGGYTLMLGLPLLTATFDLRHLHPGYWTCVLLIALTRFTLRSVFGAVYPTASQRRST